MQKFVVLGLLGLCSLEDIKRKQLTLIYILVFGIGGSSFPFFFFSANNANAHNAERKSPVKNNCRIHMNCGC